MKTYITDTKKICPEDGELKLFAGPRIQAESQVEADEIVMHEFSSEITVLGELIAEIE